MKDEDSFVKIRPAVGVAGFSDGPPKPNPGGGKTHAE